MIPGVLRVVQLNIGSLFEPDWKQRRNEIVAWMNELDPDVACFQEASTRGSAESTAHWIAERLDTPMYCEFGGHVLDFDAPQLQGILFGSAVLSRWPLANPVCHRLPVADTDSMTARIPWELVHVETAGLDVFSTHLAAPPSDGHHRVLQVSAIEEVIRESRVGKDDLGGFGTRRTAMPAVLCGDFNSEPESDEMRFLAGLTQIDAKTTFFQDAWKIAGTGPGYTQDWRDNALAASLNIHRKRIDYVWVGDAFMREGDAGRVLSAELAFHVPRTGIVASDHRGLVVDIVWPTKPDEES